VTRSKRSGASVPILILLIATFLAGHIKPAAAAPPTLEHSYWLNASLGLFTQKGYYGPDYPATPPPTPSEIGNAARLLSGHYGANRLYLIYHHEMSLKDARAVFTCWRDRLPRSVEIVPALVLKMYDRDQTRVFSESELRSLCAFFRRKINADRIAVYDIYVGRNQGNSLTILAGLYPKGLIRLGLQPGEALKAPFIAAVEDTWSGFCDGARNHDDWLQPGFGADTLRRWVKERNSQSRPTVWNLIVVAWDYHATPRGRYPGYDDANKNMPLPAGRNELAAELIRKSARPGLLAGFSSDLYILNENSRSDAHDGQTGAFYQTLKRGEIYRGYYARPFREITRLYRRWMHRASSPSSSVNRVSRPVTLSTRRTMALGWNSARRALRRRDSPRPASSSRIPLASKKVVPRRSITTRE